MKTASSNKIRKTRVKGPGIDESLLRPAHQWSASPCLSITHPELTAQWHKTKNEERTPDEYTHGSHEKVWWKCPVAKDHVWQAVIKNRALQGTGCPYCSGRRPSSTNNLLRKNPKLAKQLHPTKNGNVTGKNLLVTSSKKVWWICQDYPAHEWQAQVSNRSANGTSCPYCAGNAVSELNSLPVLFPEISDLWHPTKNGKLTANAVSAKSHLVIWWLCPKSEEHVWQAEVASVTANIDRRTKGCPFCSGKRLCKTNTLEYCYPELAREFHPTLNGELTPGDIYATSEKSLWWQCKTNNKHIWRADPHRRVNSASGCPCCYAESRQKRQGLLKEKVKKLFSKGFSKAEIARKLSISHSYTRSLLNS